jgi:hypothetical protein
VPKTSPTTTALLLSPRTPSSSLLQPARDAFPNHVRRAIAVTTDTWPRRLHHHDLISPIPVRLHAQRREPQQQLKVAKQSLSRPRAAIVSCSHPLPAHRQRAPYERCRSRPTGRSPPVDAVIFRSPCASSRLAPFSIELAHACSCHGSRILDGDCGCPARSVPAPRIQELRTLYAGGLGRQHAHGRFSHVSTKRCASASRPLPRTADR